MKNVLPGRQPFTYFLFFVVFVGVFLALAVFAGANCIDKKNTA